MRLRSISLTNIRRFAGQRLTVSDIRDGLNVLAEPNEFGKSTVLDALQALFFVPHGGRGVQVTSLVPPSGGGIGVSLDFTHAGRSIRVTKRWLTGRMALVADAVSGAPIAQGDQAERWLTDLMGDPATGPAGLIWVRQGQIGLVPDKGADRDRAVAGRRTILSAVAGEVDQMTGGRRFDAVLAGVQDALGVLVTASGRPAAGGPWKAVQDKIRSLTDEQTAVQRAVADLSDALRDRAQAQDRLRQLDDPAWVARLHQDQAAAARDHAAAEDHARQLTSAAQELQLARLKAEQVSAVLTAHNDMGHAADRAELDLTLARAEAARLHQDLAAANAAHRTAQDNLLAADAALRILHEQDRAAQAAVAARQAAEHLSHLRNQVERAQAARQRCEQARARVDQNPATQARMSALDLALADCATAEGAVRAAQVTVTVHHLGAGRLLGPDGPLPDGSLTVTSRLTVTLPGALELTIDPGAPRGTGAATALRAAETARDTALRAIGVATQADARQMADRRIADLAAAVQDQTTLDTLAPDGLAALLAQVARLADLAAVAPDAPPPPDPAALLAAQQTVATIRRQAGLMAEAQSRAALAAHAAGMQADHLARSADAAITRRGDPTAFAARSAQLKLDVSGRQAAVARAQTDHARLATQAPDLALTRAALTRADAALAALARDREDAGRRVATATGTITARADDAVQARLEEMTDQLTALSQQERALAAEVAALTHLRETLTAVRAAQRTAYFGPIQAELAPMLALLHDQAALAFDPAALVPDQLTRKGLEEPFESLSGGTQEQIAILTRLAFARLLARAGRPAPVILDDALVYSDDDRIAQMFTALHHVAADLQVIVLTCRQLAFQRLGGHRPTVTISDLDKGDGR